jgi:hypothetical protein
MPLPRYPGRDAMLVPQTAKEANLLWIKRHRSRPTKLQKMIPFLFCCPATGKYVQALRPDEQPELDAGDSYVGVKCLACGRLHLVNPATGKVLGGDEK